jgi:hypothetical protein
VTCCYGPDKEAACIPGQLCNEFFAWPASAQTAFLTDALKVILEGNHSLKLCDMMLLCPHHRLWFADVSISPAPAIYGDVLEQRRYIDQFDNDHRIMILSK